MPSITRFSVPAATAALLLVAGCGLQPGDTLVKYERDNTGDKLTEVPADGVAALWSSNDTSPQVRYPVDEGDEIGFRDERDADGTGNVIAVAGDNEQSISSDFLFERTFYWKFEEEE